MVVSIRRRLQVLVGTTLGGVSAKSTCSKVASADDSQPWVSSYIKSGTTDVSVIADRATMNRLYVDDIQRLREVVPQCPKHTPLHTQVSFTQGGSARLRILIWDINMLCGPDGSASVGSHKRIDPDLVAEVVKEINPDVICLQETIDWMPAKYKEFFEKHGVGDMDERMRQLNLRLQEQGFGNLLRSCAPPSNGSPNLVASRVPFLHAETLRLAPEFGLAFQRSAAYVEIGVTEQGSETLGVYVTHLHHMDHVPSEGRRLAEMESLLQHASAREERAERIATVVTGDFNQARPEDYTTAEWGVVSAGLAKVQQPQIDGVSHALRKAGFVCSYDAGSPHSNFGGRAAPAFTHWTGTTVDYLYMLDEKARGNRNRNKDNAHVTILGTYVVFSGLFDHLPVVTDLAIERRS